MAVVKTKMLRYGFRSSDTTITETYLVETNGVYDPTEELNNSGYYVIHQPDNSNAGKIEGETVDVLPKVNDTHPDNGLFRILGGGITAERQDNNSLFWYVTVVYTLTNQLFDNVSGFAITNRVYQRVSPGAYAVKRPSEDKYVFDQTGGLPFLNSAGELYDPADVQEDYYHRVLQFTIKQSIGFDYVTAVEYLGTVNETEMSILGFKLKPYQALMRSVTPTLGSDENGFPRWFTFYEIEIAEDGSTHELKLQDQGYMAKFDGTAREILVSDLDSSVAGQKDKAVTKPQVLDGNGVLLKPAEAAAGTVYFKYLNKVAKDWTKDLELESNKHDVEIDEPEIEV